MNAAPDKDKDHFVPDNVARNHAIASWGVSEMQGWRDAQEDAFLATEIPGMPGHLCFAVFDGHGGRRWSTAAAADEGLLEHLVSEIQKGSVFDPVGPPTTRNIAAAMYVAMLKLDAQFARTYNALLDANPRAKDAGTTAAAVVLTETHLVLANVGDSRVVCRRTALPVFATTDHKPTTVAEKARIKKAGGMVRFKRVNGVFAVSRALGDFEMKNPVKAQDATVMTAAGDVSVLDRAGCEFLVIACDGIFDVMSSEEVSKFVNGRLETGQTPVEISAALLHACLAAGSKDNMTAIVVDLLAGTRCTTPPEGAPTPVPDASVAKTHAAIDALSTAGTGLATSIELERRRMTDIAARLAKLNGVSNAV